MNLTEEFLSYPSERAVRWAQTKKMPYSVYGLMRTCKAVFDGDVWEPAGYTPDGKIPAQNGVDVILFPLLQGAEVVNIVAFEPNKKPMQLYIRHSDSNLWDFLDLIERVMS